jgi:hypothetical protein
LFRGDFLVFLLFLGITFFFWWSQTMSQDYDTVMKLPVQVTGIPNDVRVTMPAESQISVSLSGKGSALRKSGRRGGKHALQVHSSTFNMLQGHASLSTQRLRDSVSTLLPANVSIRDIEPDSLVFQYALQHSVMLPVTFDGTTESQDQFFLERIEFQPESIEAKVLLSDTVAHRVLADIGNISLSSDTTVMTVPVKPVPGVLLSTSEVRMTVIAQQYTEKSIEVPITGVNFPEYLSLKSFPSKAVVLVWVKMSEYDKVSAKDFQVVVDYNDVAGRDGSKAVLRIFSQPANVRNVRLQTRTVDYLMERKLF